MKNVLALTVVLSTTLSQFYKGASADPLTPCPDEVSKGCPYHQEEYPVYLPHPEDCSKFCECGMEGVAWSVSCKEGLFWNEVVQACDWPANVDCGDRPMP